MGHLAITTSLYPLYKRDAYFRAEVCNQWNESSDDVSACFAPILAETRSEEAEKCDDEFNTCCQHSYYRIPGGAGSIRGAGAYSANSNTKQLQPIGRAVTTLVQPTAIVSHAATTTTVKPKETSPTNPVPTPAPGTSKPTIILCLVGSDKAQMRLRVCGSNFIAGTQVQLVVSIAGNQPSPRRVVPVDAKGMFQVLWIFHGCKLAPYAVLVLDVTANHTSEVAVLQNIQFPHCVSPTPLPTVSGGRSKH